VNPSCAAILREYKRLTGLSALVNTSYNVHDEPIVHTPEDAIRAFVDSGLDVLVLGDYVARQPVEARAHAV
jgi:carbamoyltransferase